MNMNVSWIDQNGLRKLFSYMTRIGVSRKFGSVPIAWYQGHMCHAIDIIKEKANKFPKWKGEIYTRRNFIFAKYENAPSKTIATVEEIFYLADCRNRKQERGKHDVV